MAAELRLGAGVTIGGLTVLADPAPLAGGSWYRSEAEQAGLGWTVPAGTLSATDWLTADFLLDGDAFVSFQWRLSEGAEGPTFVLQFALLNQCQARLRLPLAACDQSRWLLGREGALLKMICSGSRVEPSRIERVQLVVSRQSERPARWCLAGPVVSAAEPARLTAPLLPAGPLLDEFGQATFRQWPEKTTSVDLLVKRLRAQHQVAANAQWPSDFGRWGGWVGRQFEATGWFRTEHDGQRWWLIDPAGHPFFSTGPNCVEVRCESNVSGLETALTWLPAEGPHNHLVDRGEAVYRQVNYLGANLERAFGGGWQAAWGELALAALRTCGFNTVANWSDWSLAARAQFPYVRPLNYAPARTATVFRDFPDVYDPGFAADAEEYAAQLEPTREDPALIGYFLMNEPKWGFADTTPAEGMLHVTPACRTREALADWLAARHGDGFASAWGGARLAEVRSGRWSRGLTPTAKDDLAEFSAVMVERFFGTLTAACRRVDPHHLNLGVRYHSLLADWALTAMGSFDVFSLNCYRERLPSDRLAALAERLDRPIMVGEWHFGALDAGLPASGIGRVASQADRGRAYRCYLEDAASQPWCVGVHWFTLYDQSAVGRFDGENYNIGFIDVCGRLYEPLAAAARAAHERLYGLAAGELTPFSDAPEYLSRLF